MQVAQQDSVRDFQLQEEAGLPLQLERVAAGQQPLEVAAVTLLSKHSQLKRQLQMPQSELLQQRALR